MSARQAEKGVAMVSVLLEKIRARQVTLGIAGLGYVGLPLAVEFACAGIQVIGLDPDTRKVDAVNAGRSYIPDVPGEVIADLLQCGRPSASADYAALSRCDAVSIRAPTPLNKTRDLTSRTSSTPPLRWSLTVTWGPEHAATTGSWCGATVRPIANADWYAAQPAVPARNDAAA